MNNTEIAKSVIEAIGGKENVSSVAHCATRLRIMVKDKEKIDTNRVENIEKVQGAFFNAGQFQIIFGTGTVNRIYDEVVSLGLPSSKTRELVPTCCSYIRGCICSNYSSDCCNRSFYGASWIIRGFWCCITV